MERALDFAEPFFSVKYLLEVEEREVGPKSIVVNLSPLPLRIQDQALAFFRSVIVTNTSIREVRRCLLVEDFERHGDEQALFARIKKTWVLAYEATHEQRHKGVALWRSPKVRLGNVEVNMCYADTVPLKVGLHRLHWGGKTFKEVHTQIVGYGKMQQCREQDVRTLYLEEALAPGATHQPMYDEQGNYPWHQYETITPAVFMPIEMQLSDELGV
jgi:hypothetical protein